MPEVGDCLEGGLRAEAVAWETEFWCSTSKCLRSCIVRMRVYVLITCVSLLSRIMLCRKLPRPGNVGSPTGDEVDEASVAAVVVVVVDDDDDFSRLEVKEMGSGGASGE